MGKIVLFHPGSPSCRVLVAVCSRTASNADSPLLSTATQTGYRRSDTSTFAASIGTEVSRYYCRARLFRSRAGLPCENPPLGSESVPALSSCRMWTVCMNNCLRYASYHADTELEPLMCRSQVRARGGHGSILLLTLTLRPQNPSKNHHYNAEKTTGSTQVSSTSHHPPASSYVSINTHVM